MNIFKSYKRTKFFLWINIIGLSIGLAVSITLILYVVNQLSYDKHLENHERIIRLLTVLDKEGEKTYYPINLFKAYTEVPDKVPGIEATALVFDNGEIELAINNKRFNGLRTLMVNPGFFQVFRLTFLEGTPATALSSPTSVVITRRQAEILFGGVDRAINQTVTFYESDFTVTAVVEELPKNTHFGFDVLANTQSVSWLEGAGGLEFHTYYLVREDASLQATREALEKEYTQILKPLAEGIGLEAHGETEMLSDVYLKSKALFSLGKGSNMTFIWVMTGLAFFILLLAVSNFINLFISQGEIRMNEIAIRKTSGAQIKDIVRQFFSEVTLIVLIAFVTGFILAIACITYFIPLIDINQLVSFPFILSVVLLFILTVVFSAFYPALYLSKFSPLEILGKRLKFSKRRLTAGIVIFQSVLSIVLLSFIVTIYAQTHYMKNLPLGYKPDQVLSVIASNEISQSLDAVTDELRKLPIVHSVAGSHHVMGGGWSGQTIAVWGGEEKPQGINEYRVATGFPELMQLELKEGRFWNEGDPDSLNLLLLNEAAVKMLGGESPLEKTFEYHGEARVTGVVKDFYYDNPALGIEPIVLRRISDPHTINIRFNEEVERRQAEEKVLAVLRQFDSEYLMTSHWSIDIYNRKFAEIQEFSTIILIATGLSLFIAMLGLLAIHLYSSVRRTKEIGIRRIHGAGKSLVFWQLSYNILLWIAIAAVIAIPIAWYFISDILSTYANHVPLNWMIFALPVVIQCVIALLTTSGVSLWVLSRNPVEAIKAN